MRAQPKEEAIMQLLCIPGQDFTHAAVRRRMGIMHTTVTLISPCQSVSWSVPS